MLSLKAFTYWSPALSQECLHSKLLLHLVSSTYKYNKFYRAPRNNSYLWSGGVSNGQMTRFKWSAVCLSLGIPGHIQIVKSKFLRPVYPLCVSNCYNYINMSIKEKRLSKHFKAVSYTDVFFAESAVSWVPTHTNQKSNIERLSVFQMLTPAYQEGHRVRLTPCDCCPPSS